MSADVGEHVESAQAEVDRPAMSLAAIAWAFIKIGTLAVGDTGPLLTMSEHDLVDGRGVLSQDDVQEAVTYTKPLPGSTVVQIVAYLAYKIGGWPGSAVGTAAYILPSAVMMAVLAAGYVAVTALPGVRPAVLGLTAAAVGILLATAWRFAQRNIDRRQPVTVMLGVGALVAGFVFGINAALIVIVAGFVGILTLAAPAVDAARRGSK